MESFPNNHIFGLTGLTPEQINKHAYNAFEPSLRITGQHYDVYLQGGEFREQTKVYSGADYRMKHDQDLIYFLVNSNTGPLKIPYGNGGILFDVLYLAKPLTLSKPLSLGLY